MRTAFCLDQSLYYSGPNLSLIRGIPCAESRTMTMLLLPLPPPPQPSAPGATLPTTSGGINWPAGAPWCGCHSADSSPGLLPLSVARWRLESLLRLGVLWAPEMCHVAVMVGKPISVWHHDSSCRTEEPACSSGCLPAVVKGPAAAAAEVTAAAAAAVRRLWLRSTQQAAGEAVAARVEMAGRWAAG